VSPRADLLDEAKQLITGDRNNTYGPPTQDFARTAAVLNALGFQVVHEREAELVVEDIQPHHVAMILAAVKLSRLTWSPEKRDSWVDLAGYAACGHECAIDEDQAAAVLAALPDGAIALSGQFELAGAEADSSPMGWGFR
jgi:Domain of unknown function (DUF6378)